MDKRAAKKQRNKLARAKRKKLAKPQVDFPGLDGLDPSYPAKYLWHCDEPGLTPDNCHVFTFLDDGRPSTLERFILGLDPDDPRQVRHRDGDLLNNVRENLFILED